MQSPLAHIASARVNSDRATARGQHKQCPGMNTKRSGCNLAIQESLPPYCSKIAAAGVGRRGPGRRRQVENDKRDIRRRRRRQRREGKVKRRGVGLTDRGGPRRGGK